MSYLASPQHGRCTVQKYGKGKTTFVRICLSDMFAVGQKLFRKSIEIDGDELVIRLKIVDKYPRAF